MSQYHFINHAHRFVSCMIFLEGVADPIVFATQKLWNHNCTGLFLHIACITSRFPCTFSYLWNLFHIFLKCVWFQAHHHRGPPLCFTSWQGAWGGGDAQRQWRVVVRAPPGRHRGGRVGRPGWLPGRSGRAGQSGARQHLYVVTVEWAPLTVTLFGCWCVLSLCEQVPKRVPSVSLFFLETCLPSENLQSGVGWVWSSGYQSAFKQRVKYANFFHQGGIGSLCYLNFIWWWSLSKALLAFYMYFLHWPNFTVTVMSKANLKLHTKTLA